MQFTTSDIALAAYLLMKGLPIISAAKVRNKFAFTFDDKNSLAKSLSQEYITTEHPQYDAAMRQIKRMLYGS